ncbi:MAG: 4Fe-4S binding protein [Fidelibacterota bacterium]
MIRYKSRHYPWSLRNWFQLAIFILTVAIGIQFILFDQQLAQGKEEIISRPPGVEGFLPIGSLISLKLFITTGIFDRVHPAGVIILAFAILVSWLMRKAFCGWFCPLGTLSEWLWRLGQKMMWRNYQLPKWLDIPLRGIKYLLMFFFVYAVLTMDVPSMKGFIQTRYWIIADHKMLHFFTRMTALTGLVLLILTAASLLVRNFWCRYLCPYGAFVGLFSFFSPTSITRNTETCTDCGLCAQVCPAYLPVDKKEEIRSAECTACMNCVAICPVNQSVKLDTLGVKENYWTQKRMAWWIGAGFIVLVLVARLCGVWQSGIPYSKLLDIYPLIDYLSHF